MTSSLHPKASPPRPQPYIAACLRPPFHTLITMSTTQSLVTSDITTSWSRHPPHILMASSLTPEPSGPHRKNVFIEHYSVIVHYCRKFFIAKFKEADALILKNIKGTLAWDFLDPIFLHISNLYRAKNNAYERFKFYSWFRQNSRHFDHSAGTQWAWRLNPVNWVPAEWRSPSNILAKLTLYS